MKKEKTTTFPEQVRKQYGDNYEDFAERIGVEVQTVKSWEAGRSQPSGVIMSLLNTACEHYIERLADEDFSRLKTAKQVRTLTKKIIDAFGDNLGSFSRRIGVKRSNVERWLYDGQISKSGKVLLLNVAKQPQEFIVTPEPII